MSRFPLILVIAIAAASLFVGCQNTPKGVLSHEDMAQLLADIHTGEGLIDLDRNSYRGDSLKKILKQSIFLRHGVTQEQFDTSLVWYGYHVEDYVEVYDRVIEILEQRQAEISMTTNDTQIAIAGDSVDVWQAAKQYLITKERPAQFVDFLITPDESWEKGDVYTWRLKMLNNRSPLTMTIFADYGDGATEYASIETRESGWNSVQLVLDTARIVSRIYGLARTRPGDNEYIYLDSVSLVRTRLTDDDWRSRRQDLFIPGKKTADK